jgi:hypothetical protein
VKTHHPLRAQSLRFKVLEGQPLIESAVYKPNIKYQAIYWIELLKIWENEPAYWPLNIKNTHTAMIEGLDNRTRIPY